MAGLKKPGPKKVKGLLIEEIKKNYGIQPTKKIALKLGVVPSYVRRIASLLDIPFSSHQGRYSLRQLAELTKLHRGTLTHLIRRGLRVRYSINGYGPYDLKVIDIDDFKKFLLEKAPEILAEISKKLDAESQIVLELSDLDLKIPYKEKRLFCKHCKRGFWAKIDKSRLKCPQCNKFVSKFGLRYR